MKIRILRQDLLYRLHTSIMLCVALSVSSGTFSQVGHSRRKENFDIHEFDQQSISLDSPANNIRVHHFRGITVIDARADTSNIGFMQKKVVDPLLSALSNAAKNQSEQRINKTPTFIVMSNGLQQELSRYAYNSIQFPHDTTLPEILMVVKKCWLSDELNTKPDPDGRSLLLGPASRDLWTSGIDLQIEFFLKDANDYYPMYRYDTVLSKSMTISEYGAGFVSTGIDLALQKITQMDQKISAIKTRTRFTMDDIARHNQQQFDLPALQDTGYHAGVYVNFDEFKNNKPSIINFELKRDKLADILYVRQSDGSDRVIRRVWGYCDGHNFYIKSAENFFLLQRSANAFYVFGAKNIKRTQTTSSGPASYNNFSVPVNYTSTKTAVQLEPFQLDWTTGKLY